MSVECKKLDAPYRMRDVFPVGRVFIVLEESCRSTSSVCVHTVFNIFIRFKGESSTIIMSTTESIPDDQGAINSQL